MEEPSTQTDETPVEKKSEKKGLSRTVIVAVVIIILAALAFFVFGKGGGESQKNENVVATVNGITITVAQVEDRIERSRANLEAQGNDLNDPETRALIEEQVITQLVNEELVIGQAMSLGLSATEEQVDEEYAKIRARFETEELFQSELEKNRYTEELLRENIERELLAQAYIENLVSEESIEITEEEIQALYDQVAAQNEGVPSLEELTPQIESQITSQKVNIIVQSAIENLRATASISITDE